MNLTVFIFSLFAMQLICLIVGRRASKKLDNQEDYFLAGRGIRFFPLMMTLVATQVGGGLVLGSAEEAYHYGWSVLLYPLGASLGLLILAAGIGKRMAQFPVSTVAQIFEVVYRSSRLKKIASLLSIISLFMILIAQVIASKKFMISMGVDNNFLFLAFWGLVITYTVAGGFKAVVATDIIQASFFLIIFVLCFGYSAFLGDTSIMDVAQITTGEGFELNQNKLCGWLFMPLLFMVIEQDMGQRCFAARSGKVISWASGFAALCTMLICLIPVFYGILGKMMKLEITEGSSVLMTVIQAATNPTLTALVACAILAAIISTADSLINAISSNISQDFMTEELKGLNGNIKRSQAIALGISLAALVGSFAFNNIVDLLILSYDLSVSCLLVPVLFALFKRKDGNTASAGAAVILGAGGFLLFRFFPIEWMPREICSVLCSFAGFGCVELAKFRKEEIQSLPNPEPE